MPLIVNMTSELDRTWQAFPLDPSEQDLRALLTHQLDSPSFAVPIAHPAEPAAKAFAQVLFVPAHCCEHDHFCEALNGLSDEGRILPIISLVQRIQSINLAYVLVIRPDDPALTAPRLHQSRDAEPAGAA